MHRSEALALVLGLLAALAANIGMAVQKQGTAGLVGWRRAFRDGRVRRDLATWVGGTALRVLGVVLVFPALQWGRAAIIASFSGVGLASLVVYSAVVMREPFTSAELAGAGFIAAGTAGVGYFGCGGTESTVAVEPLLTVAAGVAIVSAAAGAFSRTCGAGLLALMVAGCAGAMDGLGILFLKVVSVRALSGGQGVGVVADVASWGWLATSIASFVLLQYAYMHGRAVTVTPVFTCSGIALPIAAAPIVFGEAVSGLVLCALTLLFTGIVLLTASAGALLGADDLDGRMTTRAASTGSIGAAA